MKQDPLPLERCCDKDRRKIVLPGKDQVKYLTRFGEMVQRITAPDVLIED